MIVNLLQPSNTNSKEGEKAEERGFYLIVAREVLACSMLLFIPSHLNIITSCLESLISVRLALVYSQARCHSSDGERAHDNA